MVHVRRNSSRRRRSTVVQLDDEDSQGQWYQWFLGNEFYRRTHMCGLAHINSANSRVEVVLWYAIVIIFTVVMVNDVKHLVAEWQEQQTVTKMTMMFNKTIQMPQGTLCVFEPLLGFDQMNRSVELEIWQQRIAQLDTTDTVLNDTARWPYELYLLSTAYFSQLTKASGADSQSSWARATVQQHNNQTKRHRLAHLFQKRMLALGISDRQLLDTFSTQLHLLFGLDMEHTSHQQSIHRPSAISALTWIDGAGERFCFHFDTTNMTISAPQDRLTVGMDIAYQKIINSSSFVSTTPALRPFESKFEGYGNLHGFPKYRTELSLHLGELVKSSVLSAVDTYRVRCCRLQEASFEITGVYKRVQGCSSTIDHRTCQNDCRRELIERHCNCTPLFFNEIAAEGEVTCTIDKLEECEELQNESDEMCREECQPHCTQFTYTRWSEWHARSNEESTFFGFKFTFPIAKFALFQERYGSSWQNFVGNIGGVIDFWLGASFLGIVHLVFYLCKQAYYRLNGQLPEHRRVSALSYYVEEPEMPFADRWSSVHHKRSKSLKVVHECPDEDDKDGDDLMANMSGAAPRRCASMYH